MTLNLDSDQIRVLNWRVNEGDIGTIIGPPGCGKTTTGSMLAVKLISEQLSNKILLVAYTNAAVNKFAREIVSILGNRLASSLCVRTGNFAGHEDSIGIQFSNNAETIRSKKIVLCTILSLKKLTYNMRFDNLIIDEGGIAKLEHLLTPFMYGINQLSVSLLANNISYKINNIIELASNCGITATVIGDPKQSRPIGLTNYENSAIEFMLKHSKYDTLFTTHRLPNPLSFLVDDFARYGGLKSAPEVKNNRLSLKYNASLQFKEILNPDNVITWVDINGKERPLGPSSWSNEIEASACVKISEELYKIISSQSIAIVTRFSEQKRIIKNYLRKLGISNIRVDTTTGALGTQADVVIVSLVRNNNHRIVGAAGNLQDLNVAISRSKKKLIIIGNYEMMANGFSSPTNNYKSPSRRLAQLVNRYGKIIDAPYILKN